MIAVTASISKAAEDCWLGWMKESPTEVYRNYPENIGLVPAYHALWEALRRDYATICYFHDDLEIQSGIKIIGKTEEGGALYKRFYGEEWDSRVRNEFLTDPKLAIVGFGGALGIGVPDIYKTRYQINQLVRTDYRSNQSDWEVHGVREIGACDVAVVDGFAMCVRTEFLNQIKGWSWFPFKFHCYDTALCLMALRHGWKVRMVGVECTHHGGGTSTTPEYIDWCRENGTSPEKEHAEPHKWLASEFMDILPVRIK